MTNEKKIDCYGNEIKRIMKNGETYLVYEWKGHKLIFLEEDVETYEYYLYNKIELAFPVYAHVGLKKSLEEATTEELKDAILHGANGELSLCRVRLKEQSKGMWQIQPM